LLKTIHCKGQYFIYAISPTPVTRIFDIKHHALNITIFSGIGIKKVGYMKQHPSIWSSVEDEERMRPGYRLGLVLSVPSSPLTLMVV